MHVSQWGNSLAIRLPKSLVDALGLKPGDEVELVSATHERLAIAKADTRAAALQRMAARGWTTPSTYRFDRDDANSR